MSRTPYPQIACFAGTAAMLVTAYSAYIFPWVATLQSHESDEMPSAPTIPAIYPVTPAVSGQSLGQRVEYAALFATVQK